MNASVSIISSAATYRSLPLDIIRDATFGLSLILVGAASASLQISLPEARVRRAITRPNLMLSEPEQIDHLREGLSACPKSDWTIVTDAECANLILDCADLLFALRQRTRGMLVVPVRFDRQALVVSRYRGLAQEEWSETSRWRWIASPDGVAEIEIWSPSDRNVVWSVMTSFCSPATDQGIYKAKLDVEVAGRPQQIEIAHSRRVAVPLLLQRGQNLIRVRSDIPPSSSPTDGRRLSISISDPQLTDGGSLLLDAANFLGGGRGGPLGQARGLLHAAGFENVAGVVCGSGHIPTRSPLAASRSSPLHLIFEADTTFDDPSVEPDDTAWLFCGAPM